MGNLIVLNYGTGEVNIIVDVPKEVVIEDFLEELGFRLSDTHYMYSNELNLDIRSYAAVRSEM